MANSKLRRFSAYAESRNRTDVAIGESALFYKAVNCQSTPRRRGPARTFDVDVTGGTNKFQNRTFKVARHCVGKEAAEQDVGEVKWNPASGESDSGDGGPLTDLGRREMNDALPLEAEGDLTASNTASPKGRTVAN